LLQQLYLGGKPSFPPGPSDRHSMANKTTTLTKYTVSKQTQKTMREIIRVTD